MNDRWLALCEGHQEGRFKGTALRTTLVMKSFEQENLDWLMNRRMDWDAIVGRKSMALLRSGKKMELEGASNPACYDATFVDALRGYLLGLDV